MPALRGLLASLGASVSLAAAGSLALLVISGIVLVQGWPVVGSGPGGPMLSIAEQSVAPRSEPAPPEDDGPVALAAAPDDPAPAGADTGGDVVSEATPAADTDTSGASPSPSPTAPGPRRSAPVPTPSPGLPSSGGSTSGPEANGPVRSLTGATGGVLRGTGRTLAPTTDRLLPGSGRLVEGLTDDLGDTVESTGGALSSTLELLLGRR